MWTINPVLIITLGMFVLQAESAKKVTEDFWNILLPVFFAIICFLVLIILILLIRLIRMFATMQKNLKSILRRDSIHVTSTEEETTALQQNNVSCVSPTSGAGADNSSSTSSESPGASLADLSSGSQRYVSLQECKKTSDYINVSESASCGRADCKSTIADKDYVNVKEPRRKKVNKKGKARCNEGTTSVSSEDSDDSTVNYSKVVFTNK